MFDPARGEVAREVRLASTADVDTAVQAAKDAFPDWSGASWARRQQVLFAFREILNARKDEVAAILTSEHGKVTSDALGEVARGLEVVEFACGVPTSRRASTARTCRPASTSTHAPGARRRRDHQPVQLSGHGAAVVLPDRARDGQHRRAEAAEKDPSASLWMARALKEAGLPDGVFNVVNGDKESVDALLGHPDIASISSSAPRRSRSTSTRPRQERQTRPGARRREEPHAGAAGCRPRPRRGLRGQRRVRFGGRALHGHFGRRRRRAGRRRPHREDHRADVALHGRRRNRGCDMGPLITKEHRDKVASYIDVATADGAVVVVDGRGVKADGEADGFWLGPTLIDKVPLTSRVYTEEIFGPVLSIVRVNSYEEGLAIINAGRPTETARRYSRTTGGRLAGSRTRCRSG